MLSSLLAEVSQGSRHTLHEGLHSPRGAAVRGDVTCGSGFDPKLCEPLLPLTAHDIFWCSGCAAVDYGEGRQAGLRSSTSCALFLPPHSTCHIACAAPKVKTAVFLSFTGSGSQG